MRIGIDLRFYRPEPYGLAVHIRELMNHLVPLIQKNTSIKSVVLIFDYNIKHLQLENHLNWWNQVTGNQKFHLHWSKSKYYSFAEQTTFLIDLYRLKCDVMFFFTFNYPILYFKPFIYQVLDLSLPNTLKMSLAKRRSNFYLKLQAMLFCLRFGIRFSSHILFLSQNTKNEIHEYSNSNITDPKSKGYKKNTVIYNGINEKYISTPTASQQKSQSTGLEYSEEKHSQLLKIKQKYSITKPYLFFISVWRDYKNIERLVEAFGIFNSQRSDAYQLVLGGSQDKNFPQIMNSVMNTDQYKKGNICVTGKIEKDEDVIVLYDGAEVFVAPSLSEGFGLWLVEASSRGLPVIASDIPVFHEICTDSIFYFDPYDSKDIADSMDRVIQLNNEERLDYSNQLLQTTSRFRWETTAEKIIEIIHQVYEKK